MDKQDKVRHASTFAQCASHRGNVEETLHESVGRIRVVHLGIIRSNRKLRMLFSSIRGAGFADFGTM